MKEFDYGLDYKALDFSVEKNRNLYRIGRGEQGVLLVRPYTNIICNHWRFKTPKIAVQSANKIFSMYLDYRDAGDFIGMDCLLYTSPSPRDMRRSRMPSSA